MGHCYYLSKSLNPKAQSRLVKIPAKHLLVLGEYMDSVSKHMRQDSIVVHLEKVKNAEVVKEAINDALKRGVFRINLIVISKSGTLGDVVSKLGMVLKSTLIQSVALWLVRSEEEAREIINSDLGDIYGKGL